jgi:hypothetical protein
LLGNIIDKRTDRFSPDVDAVFEPSAHDNAKRADGPEVFSLDVQSHPDYFHVTSAEETTLRDAVLRAENDWPFPVTVYLYDRGSRPLG